MQALVQDFIQTERVYMALDRHVSHEAERQEAPSLTRGYSTQHPVEIWQLDWKRVIAFEKIGVYRYGEVTHQGTE